MGQRANYIIKNGDELIIHYNHWRANCIASDLYLGEQRFLEFVSACQIDEVIMNEPWIEGCVIIDTASRHLHFWTMELSRETSVIEYYILELTKKWNGWKVNFLNNRMYDVEKILNIDYISKQELPKLYKRSEEDILTDKIEEWETAVVIIKNYDELLVTKTGNLNIEAIVSYGKDIIPLLKDKPQTDLPKEEDEATYECIVIDTAKKMLYINESAFGLWEQCKSSWSDYNLTLGDYGYIRTLELAKIDTSNLKMLTPKVIEQFKSIVKPVDGFNPYEMAEKLLKEDKDIQFNPDFFDNVRPKKTTLEKFKQAMNKFLGRK
jgi:hypothetical protein